MKRLLLLGVVGLVGCANVTTMKINRSPDGALSINSGKDVSIGTLHYATPGGETLSVTDYTSNANTAAQAAQALREKQVIDGLIGAIKTGAALRP